MKVELEKLPDEVESYRVLVKEDDGAGATLAIGMVKRASPEAWHFFRFVSKNGKPAASSDDVTITMRAQTAEELAQVIGTRFGAIELRANRLRDVTMQAFTCNTIETVQALAVLTDSIPGFMRGIADAVAVLMHEEVDEAKFAEFKSLLLTDIDQATERLRKERTIKASIRTMVDRLFSNDDDGPETKPEEPRKH